jgi:hypothetical protein
LETHRNFLSRLQVKVDIAVKINAVLPGHEPDHRKG